MSQSQTHAEAITDPAPFIEVRQKRARDIRPGDVIRVPADNGRFSRAVADRWCEVATVVGVSAFEVAAVPAFVTDDTGRTIETTRNELYWISGVDGWPTDGARLIDLLGDSDIFVRLYVDWGGDPGVVDDAVVLFRNPFFLVDVQVELPTPAI